MIRRLIVTTLFIITGMLSAFAQENRQSIVHIGFIYPLSTNRTQAKQTSNTISLHLLAGVSRSEKALCASGFSNVILDSATGLVAAGFSNHTRNNVTGVQAAGFMNTAGGFSKGVQAAGFLNLSDSVKGAQLAGFINVALENVKGIQAAGFVNTAGSATTQIAGFANVAAKEVKGVQASGFVNVAGRVNTQIAGFVNVAHKVEGVQLAGFINIADSSDYPIGLINIVRKGHKAIGVTVDETATTLVSFRSGGRKLYGIVGVGYNFREPEDGQVAGEGGLGAHFRITPWFHINLEGVSTCVSDLEDEWSLKSTVRLMPSVRIGRSLELFAGPSFSHTGYTKGKGRSLNDHYLWSQTRYGYFNGLSLGFLAGLQVHI